jgi:hypothetical protein
VLAAGNLQKLHGEMIVDAGKTVIGRFMLTNPRLNLDRKYASRLNIGREYGSVVRGISRRSLRFRGCLRN